MKYSKLLILGRSGSGKTASLRNLDPKVTGIINADQQELMFPSTGYNTVMDSNGRPDLNKSNYVETGKPSSVIATLKAWDKRDDLKTVVLDTITHLITSYYIKEALGKDFGGYKELGIAFWNIVDTVRNMKKNVVVFGHISINFNDTGDRVVTLKSHGKMIEAFESESYFNTLLMSEVIKKDGKLQWVFRCESDETYEKVKSPVKFTDDGIVKALDRYEDNNLVTILSKLNKFYN